MIFNQTLIGSGMLVITIAIQASFMSAALKMLIRVRTPSSELRHKELRISLFVLWFFFSIVVQSWTWAMLFIWLGAMANVEEALYFSIVTYTTLGYGDVLLDAKWRLLGAYAAVNGAITIGWTTALVFLAVQRIYGFGKVLRNDPVERRDPTDT